MTKIKSSSLGFLAAAAMVASLAVASEALASGSFIGARPPKKPKAEQPAAEKKAEVTLDAEKFAMGKAVFAGEIALAEKNPALASTQKAELDMLAASIPSTENFAMRANEMAGRLTTAQLDSLQYFVGVRFQ